MIQDWLTQLDGVVEKLEQGVKVADIGCGHGLSTIIMAEPFPNSEFVGDDFHEFPVEAPRERAEGHDLANVQFEVVLAKQFDGQEQLRSHLHI